MIFPSSPFSIVELFDVNWDFIRSYILAKISERLRRGVNLVEVCPSILSSLRLKFEYTLVCENSKFMVWNNLFSFAQRHRRSCAGQKEKFRNAREQGPFANSGNEKNGLWNFENYKTCDSFCCCRYIATILKYLMCIFPIKYMLNKYYSKNNKAFTYNTVSFGIFLKAAAEMVDNLLFCNNLSTH